jgi:predicted dithiol-disulfide oxidoreductase (DUF899 family)
VLPGLLLIGLGAGLLLPTATNSVVGSVPQGDSGMGSATNAVALQVGGALGWASSHDSDFNYDFHAAITEEQQQSGAVEYNFRITDWHPDPSADDGPNASPVGTDLATYSRQMPGMSSFALDDGVVYHTYSTYARGLDALWGAYQWLDRAPLGRNESDFWWRRHDEYEKKGRL